MTGNNSKLGLAIQGSFGHRYYALGLLRAFQEYNQRNPKQKIQFTAASGCVEMMWPLWLYLGDHDIEEYFEREIEQYFDHLVNPKLVPNFDISESWNKIVALNSKFWCDPGKFFNGNDSESMMRSFADLVPAGMIKFSEKFLNKNSEDFDRLCHSVKVPVFTNALNAEDLKEIYLYSGPLKSDLDDLRGKIKLADGDVERKREVYKLNMEKYYASGARPPYIAPMEVNLASSETGSGEPQKERWMEGAMRCNPPINPLIDEGAERILLIRFFAKEKLGGGTMKNHLDLEDRMLETMFSAPLEKELEMIRALGETKGHIEIIDPTNSKSLFNGEPMRVHEFADFVSCKLDYFSHHEAAMVSNWRKMFAVGKTVGNAILEQYLEQGVFSCESSPEQLALA